MSGVFKRLGRDGNAGRLLAIVRASVPLQLQGAGATFTLYHGDGDGVQACLEGNALLAGTGGIRLHCIGSG